MCQFTVNEVYTTTSKMLYARVDRKVLGYLGRALSLELSAVQHYTTASALLRLRGLSQAADRFAAEQRQEISHVERIVSRMLVLGAKPNASQLRPSISGESLPEIIEAVEGFEREIIGFYQQAVLYCQQISDHDNEMFFKNLLDEEQEHVTALSGWHPSNHAGGNSYG